ncbi:MAG: aminotransferase class III-fold pyridoxal phosphate-dependent enzyme [Gemmatimonadaceae bacterium]|nr:aminotransferase class III-fold pyridoxal phosphate-dependent enzyme [Gemmatimonadaceae bacterium]
MHGVPNLSPADAGALAAQLYGLAATATPLPSERDQNVMLLAGDGARHILKVANAGEARAVLEAECAVMQHLSHTGLTPRVVRTLTGDEIGHHDGHMVRLITALPGTPLGATRYQTASLRQDIGRALAAVDEALASFAHPAFHRDFHWDLANAGRVVPDLLPLVSDAALRRHIAHFTALHAAEVVPLLPQLRRGMIHSDANDWNLLVDGRAQRVTGVIDFGDMVHSHVVNDLAIAMAYIALQSPDDPLAAAAEVAAGYHAVHPLTEPEIRALFPLLAMRLCTSACVAAKQWSERPDEAYLGISQGPIARVLPRLASIHPRFAHYLLRDACGLPPVPHAPQVVRWLARHQPGFAPLLGDAMRDGGPIPLDFSVGSALLDGDPAGNAPVLLDARIRALLAANGAAYGVGGYDEARLIYHWPDEPAAPEPRTIHLGIDLSTAPGTPLFAPLDGVVHGFEFADSHHDYGPVVVLRHVTDDATPVEFFTLYGHLTPDSLDGLVIGGTVTRGAEFARIGSAPTNGDWWSHVHVQVITDMLDVPCNVNGACRASQRRVWHSLCPDPNLVLGLAPWIVAPAGDSTGEIAAQRREHVGANLSVSYGARPLQAVRGVMQYLYDEDGHRFIDGYNNVAHVGHANPRVTQAVARQLGVLNTNTRYLQSQLTHYATELTALFPPDLCTCYFTASGSEANELALRLARTYTGAKDLIVMEAAYHGHTTTLIDISPYKHDGPGGQGAPDWVHTSPIPDTYRTRGITGDPGAWFAARVGEVIDGIHARGRRLCGYIAETCPSVGGQVMLPDGFLADTYARVRAAGGVCIADEVQTGFGRIGTHFWAFDAHGVTPDIVVLGKPIANGYPMGAVITTRAIAARFDNGMEFFSTFGGSTAACVAGLATLQETRDRQLQANARQVGAHLRASLAALMPEFPLIGDVRGSGLFLGVELVRDRGTLEPAASEASFVVHRMRERGVLVGTDGPHHNVIKIRGPMVLTRADADHIVSAMRQGLRELGALR